MSKQEVGKGVAYVYLETISTMLGGYLFWLIMSKITTPDVIGASSTLISIVTIFVSVVMLGIPNGVQRFLGKSYLTDQVDTANVFIKASLLILSLSICGVAVAIFLFRHWIYGALGVALGSNIDLVLVSILLLGSTIIATLFRSILIASLKTKMLALAMNISSAGKFVGGVVLVLLGTGVVGLTIGYSLYHIIASILLGAFIITTLKFSRKRLNSISLKETSKDLLRASSAAWIPFIITTIGLQAGPILVFGSLGAEQAGVYFIAFSIVTAIMSVMYSLFTIAYPVLSGMTDGRKRFAWKITKLALFLSLPLTSSFIFYSEDILQILGKEYVQAAQALQILLFSMLPIGVYLGVNSLVYAYGNYRQVLAIGLASSIPRTVLYFVFVPIYGNSGAAIGFTIGSIAGFIIAAWIARSIGMKLVWKEITAMFGISLGIAFVFSYLQINYILGISGTLIVAYLLMLRVRAFAVSEVQDSLSILLPNNIAKPIVKGLKMLDRRRGHL
jgi:O-antigen/teichoic acid export membrane protein